MAWQRTLKTRWTALGAREQRGLLLAATVLAAALVWSVGLAPALRTLQSAEVQKAQWDATSESMLALQARAKLLQAQPAIAPGEALRALQTAATALGKSASLQVVGEQATLTLKKVSVADLAPWLAPASGNAPSPAEAHLMREAGGDQPQWSGTLVFRLPAQKSGTP